MELQQIRRNFATLKRASLRAGLGNVFRPWVVGIFLIASLFLSVVGWWTYRTIQASVRENLEEWLQTALQADVREVGVWFEVQRAAASRHASDVKIEALANKIIQDVQNGSPALSTRAQLQGLMHPICEEYGLADFLLTMPGGLNVASFNSGWIGSSLPQREAAYLSKVLSGKTSMSRPFAWTRSGQTRGASVSDSIILAGAPIRDAGGRVVGALSFVIEPKSSLRELLASTKRTGSGQTFVFDENGQIISQEVGSIGDVKTIDSMASLVDYAVNLDGLTGTSGKRVIAARTWLPEYHIGLLTEVESTVAYGPLRILRRAFGFLFGLLVISTWGVALASYALYIYRKNADRALMEARQLGQYTLEERIGKGGMGEVYRARHMMLRRPTAVKLVYSDRVSESVLGQFEREVQHTSRLRHPNTIAIYDYGRTPDRIFYYAMEFLDGITLKELIGRYGPLPESRAISILLQICGSLDEAHQEGLVHRDVKPANVMLCHLGGMYDVAKVLDFGLVQEISQNGNGPADNLFAGSLRFMAPEALQVGAPPDPRRDVFAVGALAYYLLTGAYVYGDVGWEEYHDRMLHAVPDPISKRAAVSVDLEQLILRCLRSNPDERPRDGGALFQALNLCTLAHKWSREDAKRWWREHESEFRGRKERADDDSTSYSQSIVINMQERRGS